MKETVSIRYLMCIETEDLLLLATSVYFFFNFFNTNFKYIYVLKNESVKNNILQCQRKKERVLFMSNLSLMQGAKIATKIMYEAEDILILMCIKRISTISIVYISKPLIYHSIIFLSAVNEVSAFLAKGRTRH